MRRNASSQNSSRSPNRSGQRSKRGRGQSLVELAVAMPILLLMLLGTLDLGRLFFSYLQITNAVREGAGYGSHLPAETTTIKQKVTGHATTQGITASNVAVTCQPVACNLITNDNKATATITVTATWTFAPVLGGAMDTIAPGAGLDELTLQTQNTMRIL